MGHTMTVAFDTLAYAKKLKEAGFTEKQAEVQAEAIAEIIHEKLTTKKDLKELETNLRREMKELEMRLTFRLGSMMFAGFTILAILVKL